MGFIPMWYNLHVVKDSDEELMRSIRTSASKANISKDYGYAPSKRFDASDIGQSSASNRYSSSSLRKPAWDSNDASCQSWKIGSNSNPNSVEFKPSSHNQSAAENSS